MKLLVIILFALLTTTMAIAQTNIFTIDSLCFIAINDYRLQNRVHPLRWNPSIYRIAMNHSNHLVATRTFHHSHNGLAENIHRSLRCGDALEPVPENYEAIIESVVGGWKNSPGHNEMMLHDKLVSGAVAISFFKVDKIGEVELDWLGSGLIATLNMTSKTH